MGVKVEGLKELREEMHKLVEDMKDNLEMGTDDAANLAAINLRSNAPKGKGNYRKGGRYHPGGSLRNSVTTKSLPRRVKMPHVTMVGCDYWLAPHQHMVEFGNVKWGGNPFFRATIDGMRGVMLSAIQNRAEQVIRRRGG